MIGSPISCLLWAFIYKPLRSIPWTNKVQLFNCTMPSCHLISLKPSLYINRWSPFALCSLANPQLVRTLGKVGVIRWKFVQFNLYKTFRNRVEECNLIITIPIDKGEKNVLTASEQYMGSSHQNLFREVMSGYNQFNFFDPY